MSAQRAEMFSCVFNGDAEALRQLLADVDKEVLERLLCAQDEAGRSALIAAALLGRTAIVNELVKRGAEVNQQTDRGYTALHLASCWGHAYTVQTLLKLGADPKLQNFKGERPVDLARKYSRQDCERSLALGEAEQDFTLHLAQMKRIISESESSLTKDERTLASRVLTAKTEWLQRGTESRASVYTAQKKELDDALQNILGKLARKQTPT